ncbi:MAG: hypothetical protein AMJ62_07875 [Myxococcales bacterium SG8_38]|nr:MAG: hypothetical protein AMJ62_07875 [Myxococcales bacterium SG8_38]
MLKRFILTFLLVSGLASPVLAGPQSTIGGARLETDMAHKVTTGWPSTSYEWWNKGKGKLDWALGSELVYGPWSGAWDDPRIGASIYAPLRFHLWENKREASKTDLGLRFTPGLMAGSAARDTAMVMARAELAVPVSVDVHPKLSVVTGGAIPIDLGWVEGSGFLGAIPLLVRLGVEIKGGSKTAPFILMEVGPGIGFGNGSDVTLAARLWGGVTFWSVRGK